MKKVSLLNRERLNNLLSVIYNYPLTILEAPIGFGKTTAVRSFLHSEKVHSLWISFLNSTESAAFFWEKFTGELSKLNEKEAARLRALGFPINVPQFEKVTEIIGGIQFKRKTVLVIDDFHLSSDDSVSAFLLGLIAEKIENLSVVIITRNTANLNYAESLSRGLCHLISQHHLKFTNEEIRDYCFLTDDKLSSEELTKICEYTDGWISLVYLVLIGLENGIPVGMNDSIDELIEKTMFDSYDDRIKDFLFMLSIMNIFTAQQAMFLTQEEKTFEILKMLQKENAFVYYDQAAKTYKIHNVLLDYLRIKEHFSTEQRKELYRRLGEWHLDQNDFQTAYGYFYRAGDFERILSILNDPRNIRNEMTIFEGSEEMFEQLALELLYQYPIAYLQFILLAILQGSEDTIPECDKKLDDLRDVYETMDQIDEEYRNRILAEILIIRKFTIFNYIDPKDEHNQNILKLLGGKQSYIMRQDNEFTFGSPHLLYIYYREPGTLHQISQEAAISFTSYSQFADGCGTGSDYLLAAEYALETGDWKSAELNAYKAIYKAKTKAQTSIILCANFAIIRLLLLQGKIKDGIDLLKQLEKEILVLNNSFYNATLDMCKGYVYACIERPEKIPYWLQTGEMKEADLLYQGVAFNYIVYGKALLASKNYVALEIIAESSTECFSIFSNQLGFLHNGIFEAVAKCNLYGMEEGISVLKKTLLQGQADDILLPFIENGPHLINMLKSIKDSDLDPDYLKNLIDGCDQYIKNLKAGKIKKISLSQREIEVLTLAADGLKREEIAARLVVSQGTVKTHLQNIYQKLEVSGKTTAIKLAQMHGLI